MVYQIPNQLGKDLEQILADELNVKKIEFKKSSKVGPTVEMDTKITPELAKEGEARELIRQIQKLRKEQNLTLADKTIIEAPAWPKMYENIILVSTASLSIKRSKSLKVAEVKNKQ